jgi:hypothetical protein
MATFEIRQVHVPLFGVVDNPDQTAWLSTFSAPSSTTSVHVDASALAIIADDLELDAEGLVTDAERYVKGEYRSKARGMGGSRLGDLGEVLTFLVSRSSMQEVTRVVSWRKGHGQAIKGSRFPQPDFIVREGNLLAALEVKTTEAFDFLDLRDMTKKWTHLRPCRSVEPCREQALPQLGFVNGILTQQQHSLVVRDGTIVPFPVGKGIATAVMAVDGRTNALRNDSRYRTPPKCRQAHRDCWSCLPASCNFTLVTMRNAPGMLSLGGSAGDASMAWLRSYERWTQALASRDITAVRDTLQVLTRALLLWLGTDDVREPEVLRNFWGSYLDDAMRIRGLDIEVSAALGDLSRQKSNSEWSRAPLTEPVTREASIDEIEDLVRGTQGFAPSFTVSTRSIRDGRNSESVTVRSDGEWLEFDLLSETWWRQESVQTIESASLIAKRLLSFALERSGWPLPSDDLVISLRPVSAWVGDSEISLGWELKAEPPPMWSMLHSYVWFESMPPWLVFVATDERRTHLRVRPDGRASLRLSRTLLWRPSR